MVKHIVTFKFSGSAAERREACDRFAAALMALPEQIDCLESMEVGINENPAESWDLVLIAVVPTMPDASHKPQHPPWSAQQLSTPDPSFLPDSR